MSPTETSEPSLTLPRIIHTWWPLAAGWLLMTVEIPLLTTVIARMPEPKVNLAAWGIVFPLTLILGAPIMMMLAASTTLNKDWPSFQRMRRYMLAIVGILTAIHILIAFTPLYDLIVVQLIAPPAEVVEPARLGLMIMTPWLASVGSRRFNYGVLIRFNHSGAITIGVITRLTADVIALFLLLTVGGLSGIVVATVTMTVGVITEAIYSWLRVQPVLRRQLQPAPLVEEQLTSRVFLDFYLPLVATSLMQMIVQPVLSAALSRMPNPLDSLAVWPVVFGLMVLWTSAGVAYMEVVVVLLDEPRSVRRLYWFAVSLSAVLTVLLVIMNVTPLAEWWFREVAALSAELIPLAKMGMWILLPMAVFRVMQSWYQGSLLNGKQTRSITEAVVIALTTNLILLWLGVAVGQAVGLYVGLGAMVLANLLQTLWLQHRSQPVLQRVKARELKPSQLRAQHSGVK